MNANPAVKMNPLILILFMTFSWLSFADAPGSANELQTKNVFDVLFESTRIITLKYRPVYRLGSRPTTGEDILNHWVYSASIDCINSCEKYAKKLQEYLRSGELSANSCPLPYFAALEFMDANEDSKKMILVHASGYCFSYDGDSYDTEESFTEFVKDNSISIFETSN